MIDVLIPTYHYIVTEKPPCDWYYKHKDKMYNHCDRTSTLKFTQNVAGKRYGARTPFNIITMEVFND